MDRNLTNKIALVTGAARGIGQACAGELARCGAHVALIDKRDCAQTAALIARADRESIQIAADVSSRPGVESAVARTVDQFGGLDIVVANAGMSKRAPFLEMGFEDAQEVIGVVMWGVFHVCQLGARQMAAQGRGGSIVVISSVHAELGYARSAAYNMGKAAVNHMVRTAATELAGLGIRFNTIEPGWTDTPGERAFYSEEQIREMGSRLPLKRLARPEEIAKGAAYLASEDAAYITGTVLRIDGGHVLPRP